MIGILKITLDAKIFTCTIPPTMDMLPRNNRRRAFTLIEIIVVLVLVGGIVGTLAKSIAASRKTARIQQAKMDMNGRIRLSVLGAASIKKPTDANDLKAEVKKQLGDEADALGDPWGNDYEFTLTNNEVTIKCVVGNTPREGVDPVRVDIGGL
jgi:prepilin-type N-terminal cleavage/methylation domain-containing protein